MRHYLSVLLLVLALLLPYAQAQADKSPEDYSLKQYGLMLGISLLGGLVSWMAKVRKGEVKATHLTGLIGELCTAAFAGLLAFWLCEWAGTPKLLTISLVAISGHMGTRAITAFEAWAQARLGALPPPKAPNDHP